MAWSGRAVINDQALVFNRHVRLDLEYVEEGADGVTIGLIETGTDWSAIVKAPLQLTLGPRRAWLCFVGLVRSLFGSSVSTEDRQQRSAVTSYAPTPVEVRRGPVA